MNRFISSVLWKIKNKEVFKVYNEIKKYENNFEELSNKKLKIILKHAKENVSFYKDIDVENIDINNLSSLPIVTKDTIRNYFDDLVSKNKPYNYWENTSGGSTGEPVQFLQDTNYQTWVDATLYYYYHDVLKIDWEKEKKVYLWGDTKGLFNSKNLFIKCIKDWLKRVKYLNAFKMTQKDMNQFCKSINKYNPSILRGYAISLNEFANYLASNNFVINAPSLKHIFSTAEPLTEERRTLIENVFGAKVYNFYGSRETSAIGAEYSKNKLLLFMFNNYVEVINNEILITNLHNYVMPLIRFKIGDLSSNIPVKSKKVKGLYEIDTIIGRDCNIFYNKNYNSIHGDVFTHLLFSYKWIKQFRIIQEKVDFLVIKIVLNSQKNKSDMFKFENNVTKLMGHKCIIKWDFINIIDPTDTGKIIYAISKVRK